MLASSIGGILKQSTAYTVNFFMADATDGFTAEPGLTITVNISKAGAAFGAAGGTVTEIANGFYKIALSTTDTNTLGDLTFRCTGTGCRDTIFNYQVFAASIDDLVRSSTPANALNVDASNAAKVQSGTGAGQISLSSGQVIVQPGTGTGQLDLTSGRIKADTVFWNASAVAAPDTAGYPKVTIKNGTGTGEVALTSGAVALTAAAVQSIWDALTAALTTANSIGKKLADWTLGADNKVLLSTSAHTGAVIPTVTALTNDAGITQAGADKVWASATRTLTGLTGFVLSAAGVQAIWDALTSALTTAGSVGKKLADLSIGTDNRVKVSADAHTAGAAVASVTAAVTVGTNNDKTGYALSSTSLQAVEDEVLNAAVSAHTTAGSVGAHVQKDPWDVTVPGAYASGKSGHKLGNATTTDPWLTALPGAYGAGTAGKIIGDNINATISSRSTLSSANVETAVDARLDAAGTELSAVPTTTGSLRQKINLLFQYFRNKKTLTSTTETLFKEDASTSLGTATVSDDGTTFTKGELN